MATETWSDVPGWEGLYQMSNLGRLRVKDEILAAKIRMPIIKGIFAVINDSGEEV